MAGGFKTRPTSDCACLQVIKPSRIGMITFGGKQFWDAEEGEYFLFNGIIEVNESFTIVNNGLNLYVYETQKIKVL